MLIAINLRTPHTVLISIVVRAWTSIKAVELRLGSFEDRTAFFLVTREFFFEGGRDRVGRDVGVEGCDPRAVDAI